MRPGIHHAQWYVIREGAHAGLWHMQGWELHAHLGLDPAPDRPAAGGPWLAYAVCPRCAAMVLQVTDDFGAGPYIQAHEDWHHRTDYPHPEEKPE